MAFFVPQQTSWGMIRALLSMESFALCGAGDRSGSTFFPAYFMSPSPSGMCRRAGLRRSMSAGELEPSRDVLQR
jgi:hypothetical protein